MGTYAVIGLAFGDEGKGLVTNALCQSLENPLVIRYSGGQQAGHTVVTNKAKHVFSNFGSGTLADAPTHWSGTCTFDPQGTLKEFHVLKTKGINPRLYIDSECPVTTPFEKMINQTCQKTLMDGTCGAGVGATHEREAKGFSLKAIDLVHPIVFNMKVERLWDFYKGLTLHAKVVAKMTEFKLDVLTLMQKESIHVLANDYDERFDNIIFEGSQGLLLDAEYGFYPHVTRSRTGTEAFRGFDVDRYYLVTRAYQTRHGNGPMTNLDIPLSIMNNPDETNVANQYQGLFRKTVLDVSLLKYAVERDPRLVESHHKSTLVITCCDQLIAPYTFTENGKLHSYRTLEEFATAICCRLKLQDYVIVNSPDQKDLVRKL
ncbi:MAG: adenylosuccinate synthetase [Gammaproteobacteria bacterium]|nr:adenylosuccinate synthetase [Gammaproteobacteria bacterium]